MGRYWPEPLQQAATDPFLFQQLLAELLKFSLVKRLVEDQSFSIHRLVQAVQKDRIEQEMQRQWAERAVRAINAVFPDNPQDMSAWSQCLRYLDQAQAGYMLIEHYGLAFLEAASVLNRTGLYLKDHALYAIAEPLYQRALSIREQQLGVTHPNTATSLNNLAVLYTNQGKYEQAESLFRRILMIDTDVYGAEHTEVATDLKNLAELYQMQGKYSEAELLYQRILSIHEQQLGRENSTTQTVLKNYVSLLRKMGRDAEAKLLEEGS
jgi:tetratricopeptide (TPR) repeat protein